MPPSKFQILTIIYQNLFILALEILASRSTRGLRFLTKKKLEEYRAFQLYLDCKPKKEGDFSLQDFYKFYKNKNIKVFSDHHGIAIASYIKNECELYFLGVKSNQKRLGHGTKILKNLIKNSKALGTRKIFLEVNVTNEAALKLYTNAGFKSLGIRKEYYRNSLNSFDDAILMELILIS